VTCINHHAVVLRLRLLERVSCVQDMKLITGAKKSNVYSIFFFIFVIEFHVCKT
jgi:hypothetical protein